MLIGLTFQSLPKTHNMNEYIMIAGLLVERFLAHKYLSSTLAKPVLVPFPSSSMVFTHYVRKYHFVRSEWLSGNFVATYGYATLIS